MSENLKLNIICSVYNILVVVCFTIIALSFKHWWIVLFSALLTRVVKYEKGENKNE